jgi:hypothetical protein
MNQLNQPGNFDGSGGIGKGGNHRLQKSLTAMGQTGNNNTG